MLTLIQKNQSSDHLALGLFNKDFSLLLEKLSHGALETAVTSTPTAILERNETIFLLPDVSSN